MSELIRGTARKPKYSGTESTEWSAPTWQDFLSAYDGEVEGTPAVGDAPAAVRAWAAAHSLLGDADADTYRDLVFFPVVNPATGKLNERALRAVIGGRGSQADIPAEARDSAQAMARRLLEDEFDMGKDEAVTGLLFTELAGLTPGKAFDGLLAGKFVDMRGQEVEIDAADLESIVANTLALIESRRTENGDVVGLPIDEKGHDKGDAAGWIVGVELVGEVLRIVPEWTEIGLEKIGKGIQRLFSATLDLKNKVILGGSLTNWPAVDGLRPIELQAGIFGWELQAESLDDRLRIIGETWWKQQGSQAAAESWVVETFEDFVIVTAGSKSFKVGYSIGDDGMAIFAPRDEWVEVRQEWVEAQQQKQHSPILDRTMQAREVFEVDMTQEDLAELIGQQVRGQLAEAIRQTARDYKDSAAGDTANGKPAFDLVAFLELEGAGDQVVEAFKCTMLEQYEAMKDRASREAADMIAGIRREAQMTELAQRVTGGTDDAPRGFRAKADELRAHLLALPQGEAQWWGQLLSDACEHGLVEFAELGHGKMKQGTEALPAEFKKPLRQWIEAGQPLAEFFSVNADILDAQANYDLTEFVKEK